MKKIILCPGGKGDILNCTPIAKYYKEKGYKIGWIVLDKNKSVLKNNPDIDKVFIMEDLLEGNLNLLAPEKNLHVYSSFEIKEMMKDEPNLICAAPYLSRNKIINPEKFTLLQIIKDSSEITDEIFLSDFRPVVFLSEEEKKEARDFINKVKEPIKILVEYESFSEQSTFNVEYFKDISRYLKEDVAFIFSGINPVTIEMPHIKVYNYNGSFLSNAELHNLCDGFIGCCSGITCLTHSDYCDNVIPRIEVVKGLHWSSNEWKHKNHKFIVYTKEVFNEVLDDWFHLVKEKK